jgi:hypothetical protein
MPGAAGYSSKIFSPYGEVSRLRRIMDLQLLVNFLEYRINFISSDNDRPQFKLKVAN